MKNLNQISLINLKEFALSQLKAHNYQDNAEECIDYLLAGYFEYSYSMLHANMAKMAPADLLEKWPIWISDVIKGKPLQYIVGHCPFFKEEFYVDQRVLIPRPETEELVAWILDEHLTEQPKTVLDMGAGSGAIGLSLALEKNNWQVVLADLSLDALAVAKKNLESLAKKHPKANLLERVQLIQSDVYANLGNFKFDILVSNPPYISEDEVDVMDQSVLEYEPKQALFAKNDGLLIYQKLAKQLKTYVKEKAYFEIGFQQGQQVQDLFLAEDVKEVQLRKDLSGLDRMVKVTI